MPLVARQQPDPQPVEAEGVERVVLPPAEQAEVVDRRGPMRPGALVPTRARLQGRVVALSFQALDAAILVGAACATRLVVGDAYGVIIALVCSLTVLTALGLGRSYGFSRSQGLAFHLARVAAANLVGGSAGFLILAALVPTAPLFSGFALWMAASLGLTYGLHTTWWLLVRRWRNNGRLTPNIVVVGATGAADHLIEAAIRTQDVNILGIFDDRAARTPGTLRGVPVLGDTAALLDHRIMPYVDRIVITVPSRARSRVAQLIERLHVLPNEITLLLDGEAAADEQAAIRRIADVPLARISGGPINQQRAFMKRAQDLVVGSLALVLGAPIMLAVAAAVKLDSPGPALFRQRRHGFNNEEIVVWKFRSMRVEATDHTAARQVAVGDDRVTRVGRFIRRTSLDELPQIFNVLSGEMSLVGPRPHAVGMKTGDVESARLVAEYAHRHRMKPGMTGWAAIKGSRGPVDTPELVRRRVALDVEYIQRQGFWLDLYIMAMTLPCLLGDTKAPR
jgi:Undecaprenyl-phosphate glucose phosphotransferase